MKKLLSVAVTSILAVTMVTPAFASEVSHAVVPASTDATYNIKSVTPFAEPVTKMSTEKQNQKHRFNQFTITR
ncbi:hypothetical protein MKY98_08520 [Paenibacillus sp. FSL M8-0228]|jgi:hypothetical protein|uniref:hypothetical protein n=1 Tax=Paenibacillus TaxID=44249 RepID=UPI00083D91D6|nr:MULTISPECIES: hypothetical protein [Paenibacillus]MBO3283978.1 hypothetical protein [Paenibacillus polymyxa]MBP1310969.1 hypothetical protein [Paenibacillus sp. 1182]ODB56193.1 hypothetical protein A7311_17960 [Paenibacillus polymyxa]